ncbi:MAG: hypothetical protein K2Y37_24685 [Pirellulales bacterium]|nr:hypothetical protein [Pirellulales bacterium]
MKPLRKRLLRGVLGVGIALATIGGAPALGQEAAAPAAPPSRKSYVYQYFLVGLCVALGMALLCKPANRDTHIEKHSDHV